MDQDVHARIQLVEGRVDRVEDRVESLEESRVRHERELYGGADDDGERTVSVLERLDTAAASLKRIDNTIAKAETSLRAFVPKAIKALFRAGWVIAGVFVAVVGFIITHIGKIERVLTAIAHALQ